MWAPGIFNPVPISAARSAAWFALKEAALAKTVAGDDFQATIIYMDMRTFGKTFERYGQHAESTEGVRLERGRVHSIAPTPGSDDVAIRWTSATGDIHEERFDLVVLSVGQRANPHTAALAEGLDVDTDEFGFVKTAPFSDTQTLRAGIFAGGTLTGPTDIAESMIRASSAAVNASRTIHRAGGGLAEKTAAPKTGRDVSREPPRILVILCRCEKRRGSGVGSRRVVSTFAAGPGSCPGGGPGAHLHGPGMGRPHGNGRRRCKPSAGGRLPHLCLR